MKFKLGKLYNNLGHELEVISFDGEIINVFEKIHVKITSNSGYDFEHQTKVIQKNYTIKDIGTLVFFSLEDINCKFIHEDPRYVDYRQFILDNKNKSQKDIIDKIIKQAPDTLMTIEEKKQIINNYYLPKRNMSEDKSKIQSVPYEIFGRIDFDTEFYAKKYEELWHKHYYEKFYIAKNVEFNLNFKEIIDWRTEIASIFYDNEKTRFSSLDLYKTREAGAAKLSGKDYVYNSELMLKRKFLTNPFSYLNLYISGDGFYSDGAADEFLVQVMLRNRETRKIQDIVKTIQGNQNRIIRHKSDESFLVQGCAGSGKTMILLHRLSYLKYNSKLPHQNKVKIITPNDRFIEFFNELAISLELENIDLLTMEAYYLLISKMYFTNNKSKLREKYKDTSLNEQELRNIKKASEFINQYKSIDEKNEDYCEYCYSKAAIEKIENVYNQRLKEYLSLIGIDYLASLKNRFKCVNLNGEMSGSETVDLMQSLFSSQINNENHRMLEENQMLDRSLANLLKIKKFIDDYCNVFDDFIEYAYFLENDIQALNRVNRANKSLKMLDALMGNAVEYDTLIINTDREYNEIIALENHKLEILDELIKSKDLSWINRIVLMIKSNIKKRSLRAIDQERIFKLTELRRHFLASITEFEISGEIFNEADLFKNIVGDLIQKNIKDIENTLECKIVDTSEIYLVASKFFASKFEERKVSISNYLDNLIKYKSTSFSKNIIDNYTVNYNDQIANQILAVNERIEEFFNNINECLNMFDKSSPYENFEIILTQLDNIFREVDSVKILLGTEKKSIDVKIESIEAKTSELTHKILKSDDIKSINICLKRIVNRDLFVIEIAKEFILELRAKFFINFKEPLCGKHELFVLLNFIQLHYGEVQDSDLLIVIDEAQEYRLSEYVLLKNVFSKNARFNIFGDLSQQLVASSGYTDWIEVCKLFNSQQYILNENYRNTIEINDFINETLKFKHLSIGIHGESVKFINQEDIIQKIKDLQKENSANRIAIIYCQRNNDLKYFQSISEESKSIIVSDVNGIKGIEFDVTFVFPENMSLNEKYIAYSRALNQLYIVDQ